MAFFRAKSREIMQNRALPQLPSSSAAAPSCTSRAHKAETQCTSGAQRQRSRCQQQRYNAALHRQSYTLPYSALARQRACMLVLRLHLAATARRPASDNVRACQATGSAGSTAGSTRSRQATERARGTMEASRRDGMRTMDMALKDLYESGQVEYEDVLRYLANPRAIVAPSGRVAPTGGRGGGR